MKLGFLRQLLTERCWQVSQLIERESQTMIYAAQKLLCPVGGFPHGEDQLLKLFYGEVGKADRVSCHHHYNKANGAIRQGKNILHNNISDFIHTL